MTKIGRANADYWIEAVAEGGEDYYSKPGESPGQWLGDLAAELGLEGEVDRAAYAALLAGKHPASGEVLIARPAPRRFTDREGRERMLEPILGYDIRFAAPKSVSLLYAVGSPEVRAAALRAHDHGVAEAISYLERHACFVQRGKGGISIESGSGFVAMAFRHRSSRAGDPALHTHVVTANVTRAASDGRWLSLANPKSRSPLLREAKAAGHVYQAALRAEVTRELGLEWSPLKNGYADLAAIDREVIDHFSRRRAEIVAAMAERGTSSPAAAEVAAYATRSAKDYEVDPDTQRAEWRSRAAEFELGSRSIEALVGQGHRREPRLIEDADLDSAIAALEERRSHFDRRDLLCAVADQLPEGADNSELVDAVEALLASERLIAIHQGDGPLATTDYTTPRLWELEQRFMATARVGEGAGAATVERATLEAVLERHSYLSAEQAEMVRRLTTGGEGVLAVAALPGTGKTTALAAAQEAWAVGGVQTVGVASARSASGELSDAGVPATSITALLIAAERRVAEGAEALPRGAVIVADEASTISTPHAAALAELAEGCGGKLVLIGDPRQIGAVGPGGLYGALSNEMEPVVLREIRRQRDPADRRIVALAHEGRGSDALDLLRERQRLVIADTLDEALDAQVLDWHRSIDAGEDSVMIARRTRDVADLNDRARALLAEGGGVGEESLDVGGRDFACGDHLITRVNTHQVSNRERWRVVGVDTGERTLELERLGGELRRVVVDANYLDRLTPSGEPAVQHAYALTTYSTESKTFESAFALLDSGLSREDFTVAVSRARGQTVAYGVAASEWLDPELGPARREIEDAAHELRRGAERGASEFAALQVSERKRVEAMSGEELARRRAELEGRREGAYRRRARDVRIERLDAEIADAEDRVGIGAGEVFAQTQLRPLVEERDRLSRSREREAPSASFGVEERAELEMIEERISQLCRRQVAAERLLATPMIEAAIGPRPQAGERAVLWNEGVNAIYAYRRRHGILSPGGDPLGTRPVEVGQARERRAVERRLGEVREALGLERGRGVERSAGIER